MAEFERRVRIGLVGPDHRVCLPAVTGASFVPARELEVFRGLYSPEQIRFRREFRIRRVPVLTLALIAANVLAGIWVYVRGGFTEPNLLLHGAMSGPMISELGEWWRIITANFLHAGWTHLSVNMLFLFFLGLAVENAYSRRSYVLVLLASGVGAVLLSFLFTPNTSVGASGLVFGVLGAAGVFGFKYRHMISSRYRRTFAWSWVYLVYFFYAGLADPRTDNWGHVGGLIGGCVAAALLPAELLEARPARGVRAFLLRAVPAALVVSVLLLGGFIARPLLPTWSEHRDELGLGVSYPAGWAGTYGVSGQREYFNTLGVTLAVSTLDHREPVASADVAERYMNAQLLRLESLGFVTDVEVLERSDATLAGRPATRLVFRFKRADGIPRLVKLYAVAVGDLSHTVSFVAPEILASRYEYLAYRMFASVRLHEPKFLSNAREDANASPGNPLALVRYGRALAKTGEVPAAAEALERALAVDYDFRDAHMALAALHLRPGGDPAIGARHAELALSLGPESLEAVTLAARHRARAGKVDSALDLIDRALTSLSPADADALIALRASIAAAR